MSKLWLAIGAVAGACIAVVIMWLIVVPIERAAAVKGKVDEYRATSAEAERDELQRQLHGGQIVIEAYQEQLKNSRAKEEATANDLEKRIAENEALRKASGRSDGIDDADVKFLLQPE
jgi:flagellar biosynthesis/type III secretory pathway M-ring protein FliF/YscJ